MIAALLILIAAQPSDEALRNLEIEDATAKGKQEKGLEAIDKLLKIPACSKPKACPVCPVPEAALLDVRVEHAVITDQTLSGVAEVWRVDPPPAEKVTEGVFSVPIPPPPSVAVVPAPRSRVPAAVLGAGGFVLGIILGVLVAR